MDIKKLQEILMSKGIRITDDDPIFIMVALNEVVLEDMTKQYLQALNNIKTIRTINTPLISGSLTLLTISAVSSLTIGVAIGSNERYIMLVGVVGLFIGIMLGSLITLYLRIHVTKQVNAPANMNKRINWTEDEFQKMAITTQLSNKTLAACHDVLVSGMSIADAASRHGVLNPQILRGLRILEN